MIQNHQFNRTFSIDTFYLTSEAKHQMWAHLIRESLLPIKFWTSKKWLLSTYHRMRLWPITKCLQPKRNEINLNFSQVNIKRKYKMNEKLSIIAWIASQIASFFNFIGQTLSCLNQNVTQTFLQLLKFLHGPLSASFNASSPNSSLQIIANSRCLDKLFNSKVGAYSIEGKTLS